MKLPPHFHPYDGSGLRHLAFDCAFSLRSYAQLKRQQHRSHLDQYERGPRSRIKSFRKEYGHLMRRYLPDPLIEPPLPTFERMPVDEYERALLMASALRGEMR